jgi:hypothetical protein
MSFTRATYLRHYIHRWGLRNRRFTTLYWLAVRSRRAS